MAQSFEQLNELEVEGLELLELREYWAQAWKIKPHSYISRKLDVIAKEENVNVRYVARMIDQTFEIR